MGEQKHKETIYAFIDSQNLNLSIQKVGWRLDFKKFRTYLSEKHDVSKAFLFLGYIPENQKLYKALKEYGFTLIYKPILMHKDGLVKGNCDAELVLQAMIEYAQYDKAIIATGDGDFFCLIKYLMQQKKLSRLIIPNKFKYSKLLKQVVKLSRFMTFMNDLKDHLEYKKESKNKKSDKKQKNSKHDKKNIAPKSDIRSGGLLKDKL